MAPCDGPPPVEVGDPRAGLLQHHQGTGQVPRVHAHLDHRLRGPFGHERVAPEVAEAAITPGAADERAEAGRLRLDVGRRAVDQLGVLESRHGRDVDPPRAGAGRAGRPGDPRAPAAPRVPALPEGRRGDHADLHLAVARDADERAEQGHPADEVVGPVDGVQVPAHRGLRARLALLLADEPVVGMGGQDPLAQAAFDGLVDLRHQAAVRLGGDLQAPAGSPPGPSRRPRRTWPGRARATRAAPPRCPAAGPRSTPRRRRRPTDPGRSRRGSARWPDRRAARGPRPRRSTCRRRRPPRASRTRRVRPAGRRRRCCVPPRSRSRPT